jgi:hypothetical protein
VEKNSLYSKCMFASSHMICIRDVKNFFFVTGSSIGDEEGQDAGKQGDHHLGAVYDVNPGLPGGLPAAPS